LTYAKSLERFPTLRQSRLATFDRCALSAWFDEEYRQDWSSHEAASGQIIHRAIAKALQTMAALDEAKIETGEMIAILDETLRQHDIDQECPKCFKPITRKQGGWIYCDDGHKYRSQFVNIPMEQIKDLRWIAVKFAYENSFDIERLIDVEHRLSHTIRYQAEDGSMVERVLTGQIDAMFAAGERDEEVIVLDWKSGWGMPGPAELGFDGYFQQRFYAWLVFRNYPLVEKVTLREFYLRFSETREAVVFRDDMDDVEAELAALAERFDRAFAEENFPASPGHHCQLCARPAACPIFPGVRGEGRITDKETAQRAAREATVAEAVLSKTKEALSAWTSVHGPEEVSSHKGKRGWIHKESKRTARPSKKQMEEALAAQRAGVPIQLDKLYKTSTTTRFGLHAIPQIEDSADDAALMEALQASIDKQNGSVRDAEYVREDRGD
jgi:hypothetical protein